MITAIRNQPFQFGSNLRPRSLAIGCDCEEANIPSLIALEDQVWVQCQMLPCYPDSVSLFSGGPGDWDDWIGEDGWFIDGSGYYRYNGSVGDNYRLIYDAFTTTVGDSYTIELVVSNVTGQIYMNFGEDEDIIITADGTYTFQVTSSIDGAFIVGVINGIGGVTVESVQVSDLNKNVSAIFHQGSTIVEFAQSSYPGYFDFNGGKVTFHMDMEDSTLTEGCFTLEMRDNCSDNGITSQEFSIVDADDCKTLVIRACNDYDNIGFATPFAPRIRILANMGWPSYNTELNEERESNGEIFRPYADRTSTMTVRTGILNQFDHAFLSTLPLWDHVYVEDQEVVVAKGKYEPNYGEDLWLSGQVRFDVSPKAELVRKVSCGPALEGCAPANDPICFNPQIVSGFYAADGGLMTLWVRMLNNLNFEPGDASVTVGGGSPVVQNFGTLPDTLYWGPFTPGAVVTFRLVNADDAGCVYTQSITVPEFECAGTGYGQFKVDGGTEFGTVTTTTLYVATRNAVTGELTVHGDGVTTPTAVDAPEEGNYCMWSCDSDGYPEGDLTTMANTNGYVSNLVVTEYPLLEQIVFTDTSPVEAMDFSGSSAMLLFYLHAYAAASVDLSPMVNVLLIDMQNSTALTDVLLPASAGLSDVNFSNCALTVATVNAILAHLVAIGMSSGAVRLDGGTNAAPTGQGVTDAGILTTAGVTVVTN